MFEYREEDPEVLNISSAQNWIPFNEFMPQSDSQSKGDWCGSYLCIVERERSADSFVISSEHGGDISRSVEICYFNSLSKSFQDSDRKFVKVTHWAPIPTMPKHKATYISRDEMTLKVLSGYLVVVYHLTFKKFESNLEFEGMNDINKQFATACVSYDEHVYISTLENEQGHKDVMYCIEKRP